MPTQTALIAAWARSAVVPRGGAFKSLHAHDIAAPVVQALLARAGIAAEQVDALVMGNALGAGGNPARMLVLHAGLSKRCAALTVDTQCCAGLDAVAIGVGLIATGQADVVVAGGGEAWSRSPIRMHRPMRNTDAPVAYERPAFAPNAEQDPDMLLSAARFAAEQGYTRAQQEAFAIESHQRAVQQQTVLAQEIVPVAGISNDVNPRVIDPARAARMPEVVRTDAVMQKVDAQAHALTALTVAAQADGAAFVLLISPTAAKRLGIRAQAAWQACTSVGDAPETPLLAAQVAARLALKRVGLSDPNSLCAVSLHDAFAVQGLSFMADLGLTAGQLNPNGGGVARGHPIGASAAIALVRLLADLAHNGVEGDRGLVAVAGAGGLGSAAVIQRL